MPGPKSKEIQRGNEDHFRYVRKDIKEQFEKAGRKMPGLGEFVVLVTVPGWCENVGEDEDW